METAVEPEITAHIKITRVNGDVEVQEISPEHLILIERED